MRSFLSFPSTTRSNYHSPQSFSLYPLKILKRIWKNLYYLSSSLSWHLLFHFSGFSCFIPFPLVQISSSCNSNFLVSVPSTSGWGLLWKQSRTAQPENVISWFLSFHIDSTLFTVGTARLYRPVYNSGCRVQYNTHDHALACNKASNYVAVCGDNIMDGMKSLSNSWSSSPILRPLNRYGTSTCLACTPGTVKWWSQCIARSQLLVPACHRPSAVGWSIRSL